MNNRLGKSGFVCLVLISLLVLPGFIQAQKQKIKVTTEGASIRVKPDAGSEVMATPEVGTVYEVEAKIQDWFEIKLKTDLGVMITGYIHAMYVETESPVAQEVEPIVPKEVKVEPAPEVPTAEPKRGGPADRSVWPRFEFNIAAGYGSAQFEGSSIYAYNWSHDMLEYVRETTNLSQKADNAIFFGEASPSSLSQRSASRWAVVFSRRKFQRLDRSPSHTSGKAVPRYMMRAGHGAAAGS